MTTDDTEAEWWSDSDGGELRVLFTASLSSNSTSAMDQCRRFPTLFASNACPYPGFCAEIVGLLAKRMGMHVTPVVVRGAGAVVPCVRGMTTNCSKFDGHGGDVMAMLDDGRIDTACPFFQRTKERERLFDFSEELFQISSSFVVHRRNDLAVEGMWSLFHPYTDFTWVAIVTTLVLQLLAALVIVKVERKLMGKRNTLPAWEVVWRMVRLQLLQPQHMKFSSVAGKVMTLTFCVLQCLLVVSLYQAWIVYSLVRQKPIAPFTDLAGLLREMDAGRERLIEWDNKKEMVLRYWFFEGLKSSSNYPYSALRPILTKFPAVEVERKSEIIPYLERGGYVAVTQDDDPVHYIAAGHCQMMSVSLGMPRQGAHFVFRKGSPLVRRLNAAIHNERIFIRKIMRKYKAYMTVYRAKSCAEKEEEMRSYKPFGVVPLVGLGVMAAVFMVIALIVLVIECLVAYARG